MTTQILKYILWALLCIPIFLLGIFLFNNLIDEVLAMRRKKEEEKKELELKLRRRKEYEDEYWRRHGGGFY